jgi:hypothetical protein
MKLLEGIKTKQLEKYILKEKLTHQREVVAAPYDNIKSFGLLIDGRQNHVVTYIEQFQSELTAAGRNVTVLAYLPKLAKGQTFSLPYFSKSQHNWMGVPNSSEAKSFMQTPFDLLINFSPDKILPLECICALSTAKYIIGNGTEHLNHYYDFLLKLNNSNAPESLIENVHHYLNLQQQV